MRSVLRPSRPTGRVGLVYGLWLCEGDGVGWSLVGLGEALGDSVGLGDGPGEGLGLGDREGLGERLGNPGVMNTDELELADHGEGTGEGCSEEIWRSRTGGKVTLGEGGTWASLVAGAKVGVGASTGVCDTDSLRVGRVIAEVPVLASWR
jgi:hypothetical protein